MMRPLPPPSARARLVRVLVVLCLAGWLGGCGAGIAGGILAGSDSSSSRSPPTLQADALSAVGPLVPPTEGIPLDPRDLILRDVVVDNYVLPGNAKVRVLLKALGVSAEQFFLSVVPRGQNSTTVRFVYTTTEILEEMSVRGQDPTSRDVPAELVVLVDGAEVAAPLPFLLQRQPKASLVLGPGQSPPALISTLGTSRLKLRVESLGSLLPSELEEMLEMRVAVFDRQGRIFDVRAATELKVVDTGDNTGDRYVEATPPESSFPSQAFVFLSSQRTGRSPFEGRVFYRPHLGFVSQRVGSLDGGTEVTLTGKGLVPLDLTNPEDPKLDFSRVELRVEKGGRLRPVPDTLLHRHLSSGDSLAFTMPPSPDGRSGPAFIELEVALPSGLRVKAQPSAVFSYGDGAVSFGGRGAVLRGRPLAVDSGPLLASGAGPEDLVTLYSDAGRPQLQLYAALDNGLFARLGAPFPGGDPQNPRHRGPVDACVGDFDGDGRADVFIANEGAGSAAEHTLLLGHPAPEFYLLPSPIQLPGTVGPQQCLAGKLGGGAMDVLVLSNGSTEATIMESQLQQPSFTPRTLASGLARFDAALIEDLNGDGYEDIVMAERFGSSGSPPTTYVRILYFEGRSEATPGPNPDQVLLATVPGYEASSSSRVVGLHAVGDQQYKHVAMVLEGIPNNSSTPPTVAVVRNSKSGLEQPVAGDTIHFGNGHPGFSCSASGDLNDDQLNEVVVASKDGGSRPLEMLRWSTDAFGNLDKLVVLPDSIDIGIEPMTAISQLWIGTASGATLNTARRTALFVVHQGEVDSLIEQRITTLIAAEGPRLMAPTGHVEVKMPIKHLTLGEFRVLRRVGTGQSLDVFVAGVDTLQLLVNDDIGTLSEDKKISVPGLIPSTVTTVKHYRGTRGVDSVAFLAFDTTAGCRIGFIEADTGNPVFGATDLRVFAPKAVRGRAVDAASRVLTGDFDGDTIDDIVVLLNLKEANKSGRDGDAVILFLKGTATPTKGTVPVAMPDVPVGQGSPTHGNATSIVDGHFSATTAGGGPTLRQLAVAIPQGESASSADGNHIRFYNFTNVDQQTKGARFERSYVSDTRPVLVAGSEPRVITTADFDGDGTTDIAVAGGDELSPKLRIFYNTTPPMDTITQKVDIARFVERTSNPLPLAPGIPHSLTGLDINGDQLADVVASTRDFGTALRYSIGHYLNPSIVDSIRGQALPPSRTGTLVQEGSNKVPRNAALSMAVGDMNGDGRPDIVLGWDSAGAGDLNLRVLFGNN